MGQQEFVQKWQGRDLDPGLGRCPHPCGLRQGREGTVFLTHLPSLSKGGLKRLPLAIFCGNWGRMKLDPSSLHCRVSHLCPSSLTFSSQPLPGQYIGECPVPAVVIEPSRCITMGEQ